MERQFEARAIAQIRMNEELMLGAEALVSLDAGAVDASAVENLTADTRVQRAVWEDDGPDLDEGEVLGLAESIRRSLDLPID